MDLIDELREVVHVWEFTAKHKGDIRINSKVKSREMQEGNLVLKEEVLLTQ